MVRMSGDRGALNCVPDEDGVAMGYARDVTDEADELADAWEERSDPSKVQEANDQVVRPVKRAVQYLEEWDKGLSYLENPVLE